MRVRYSPGDPGVHGGEVQGGGKNRFPGGRPTGRRNGDVEVGVDFFVRVKKRLYIFQFDVRASLMGALSVWIEGYNFKSSEARSHSDR